MCQLVTPKDSWLKTWARLDFIVQLITNKQLASKMAQKNLSSLPEGSRVLITGKNTFFASKNAFDKVIWTSFNSVRRKKKSHSSGSKVNIELKRLYIAWNIFKHSDLNSEVFEASDQSLFCCWSDSQFLLILKIWVVMRKKLSWPFSTRRLPSSGIYRHYSVGFKTKAFWEISK